MRIYNTRVLYMDESVNRSVGVTYIVQIINVFKKTQIKSTRNRQPRENRNVKKLEEISPFLPWKENSLFKHLCLHRLMDKVFAREISQAWNYYVL